MALCKWVFVAAVAAVPTFRVGLAQIALEGGDQDGTFFNLIDYSSEVDEEVRVCHAEFILNSVQWFAYSGLPLELGGDPRLHAMAYANCAEVSGRLVRIKANLSRVFTSHDWPNVPQQQQHFQKTKDFYSNQMPETQTWQIMRGISLCVPLTCKRTVDLAPIAFIYFSCVAHGHCLGLTYMPPTVDGVETTVLADPDLAPSDVERVDGSFVPAVTLGPACGPGCRVPWWLGCTGETVRSRKWYRWVRAVSEAVGGATTTAAVDAAVYEDADLVREADSLVEGSFSLAMAWCKSVVGFTVDTCGAEHLNFRESTDPLDPPPNWAGVEVWKYDSGFCPHAYVAALALRTAMRRGSGLLTSAAEDLRKMRAVLGGCDDLNSTEILCCAASWSIAGESPGPGGPVLAEDEWACEEGPGTCGDTLLAYGARLLHALPLLPER